MSNLPPGVGPNDLPGDEGNRVPKCFKCDKILDEESNDAILHGIQLCDEHATSENIEFYLSQKRMQSGIECEVCGRPLLKSEASNIDPTLCSSHDLDDLEAERQRYEDVREELKEQYKNR